MWNESVLNRQQVLGVFVVLSFIYVFPIVHADYAYIDDNWRSLLLAEGDWISQGRVLLNVLYQVLTFTAGTTNIFPLPLFISLLVIALAMSRLTLRYFPAPTLSSCLVVLPVLCNPFFLGNLTYQYDGPGMVLAVAACIYAVTIKAKSTIITHGAAVILLAVTLSLYQLTVALFIALSSIEFMWNIKNSVQLREAFCAAAQRLLQCLGGGVLYFISAYQWVNNERGDFQAVNADGFTTVSTKFLYAMDKIQQLVTPGNAAVIYFILLVACVGFGLLVRSLLQRHAALWGKIAALVVCLAIVPLLVVCVPGAMLFVAEPNLDARNFIAFAGVIVLLFWLVHEALGRWRAVSRLILIVPVLCMFSFSYAYGQILVAKKELEFAMAQYIAKDIVSQDSLNAVNVIYFIGPSTNGNWLPRGHAAMTFMPVLRYILSSSNTVLHSQVFTRFGINNVVDGGRDTLAALVATYGARPPLVETRFYSLYVFEHWAAIVMKDIVVPEDHRPLVKAHYGRLDFN